MKNEFHFISGKEYNAFYKKEKFLRYVFFQYLKFEFSEFSIKAQ